MQTERGHEYLGKELGDEAVNRMVKEAEDYCECEKVRIEMANQPEILSLRADLALLGEKERDLKERSRHATPPGDVRKQRRQSTYCWTVVAFLAVAGFFFTVMAFDPYRFGWKIYLYAMGVATVCAYCVDKFIESWGSPKVVKALAAASCCAAIASLTLLALVRGEVLAQYVQSSSPAILIDGDLASVAAPHTNFFEATLSYLRIAMALLAFAMELGAGLALNDARRLSSNSGEDYHEVNKERDAVCQAIVVRIQKLNALQNAPQAFVAEFWRDFHRALLNGANRSALKRLSIVVLAVFLSSPVFAQPNAPVHVGVVLDSSLSEAARDNDNKPELEKNRTAISRLLGNLPAGARVTIIGITDQSFAQPYILLDAKLDPDEGYFKERLAAARRQLVTAWGQRCANLHPKFPHTDEFGALLVAAELFKKTPEARHVLVIFSDMRQETSLIDLETPASISVERSMAKATKLGLLADLPRVEVHALGVDAAGKTVLYWNSLRDFWAEYFRKAGANLKSYSILRDPPDEASFR